MANSEIFVGTASSASRIGSLLRTVSLACQSWIERERRRDLDDAMRRLDHTGAREDYRRGAGKRAT
jgi:hypothetical protein